MAPPSSPNPTPDPDPSPEASPTPSNTPATSSTDVTATLSVPQTASITTKASRPGRRPKFSASDDLVIVREVAAAKAHVAPNGETKERFQIAATRANATNSLSCPVTWKSIQDRYKRLQLRFDKKGRQESLMSGVGGELGEMEELLSSMKEARDDRERETLEKRNKLRDKEAEKERLGAVIREQALKRRADRIASKASSSDDAEEDNDTPKKQRRLVDELKKGFDAELRQFTDALTRGDEERSRIEKGRLKLDRERFESEKSEREKDRQERRDEREAAQLLELQKFRAMLELVGKGTSAAPQ